MGFLKNKRVLVTGGHGFLGSFVVNRLKAKGCSELFIPRSNEYDLRKETDVVRVYRDSRPDIVIHLAASVGGIMANRKNPGKFFYDNAIMGIQLIEFARQFEIKKFVCIGTVCSYPKYAHIPFKEESLWNGYPEETNAPYGLSKKMHLVQLQGYIEQYGFNGIYLILSNLYGPGESFDLENSHVTGALIRKCYDAIDKGENKILLWGDGSPTREFLYVDDAAEGILLAAERYNKSDPINLASGNEISIKELAEIVKKVTGFKGEILWDVTKPNGQPRRCVDTEKAQEEFGFKAKIPFEEGLSKMAQWYLENLKHRK